MDKNALNKKLNYLKSYMDVNVYNSDNCLVYANVKHNSGTVTVYSNTKISGKICIV